MALPKIDYAPGAPVRRRILARRAIGVLLLIVIIIAAPFAWRRFLAYRAERQARLNQELVDAAYRCDLNAVQESLRRGAQINARWGSGGSKHPFIAAEKWTALIALAHSGKGLDPVPIARLLADRHADLDLDDGYGTTALCAAIDDHQTSLALFLLQRGAKVNTRQSIYIDGPGGLTPLHLAVGNPVVVRELIAHGAALNARTSGGDTPLHRAANLKDIESVRLLLKAGADPNAVNLSGHTPLMIAYGPPDLREAMDKLANSSDPGERALYRSYRENLHGDIDDQIAELLVKAGAKWPAPPTTQKE